MRAISRAVFAQGRLWLLEDEGSLSSLAPDETQPRPVALPGKAIDICKAAGTPVALVADRDKWALGTLSAGWKAIASVATQGDGFVALDCGDGAGPISLVSNRRLVELRDGQTRSTNLRQPLQEPSGVATTFGTADSVWIGVNAGEWGGGLRRIARRDGAVETVERNRSGDLCGGPLNTSCDPVTGIVAAPWNSACVVVAIGLVHLMSHGRLVEVCGSTVRRLYFKALDPQPPRGGLDEGEPPSTVAFFGLASRAGSWWAVGTDGLYRFEGVHGPDFRPLPTFQNKGGYSVSFDIPGLALVLTDVNRRRAVSGSVPIMAVR